MPHRPSIKQPPLTASACRSVFVLLIAYAAHGTADEWPGLRGPNHDGSAARGTRFATGDGALAVGWRARLGSG